MIELAEVLKKPTLPCWREQIISEIEQMNVADAREQRAVTIMKLVEIQFFLKNRRWAEENELIEMIIQEMDEQYGWTE